MSAIASLHAFGRRIPALAARLRQPLLARVPAAASARCSSSGGGGSSSNPLFDLPASATKAAPKAAPAATEAVVTDVNPRTREAIAHYRNLPVSPKKLRVVARLAFPGGKGLFWREAMAQLEFCRKNMAVMVKNAISSAAGNAEHRGLDRDRLVVKHVTVGKGSYFKKPDPKNKGRFGIRKMYFSHLRVTLKEVSLAEVQRTKDYARWQRTAELLAQPWEERVKQLPRYRRPPGYDPTGEGLPPADEQGDAGATGAAPA